MMSEPMLVYAVPLVEVCHGIVLLGRIVSPVSC